MTRGRTRCGSIFIYLFIYLTPPVGVTIVWMSWSICSTHIPLDFRHKYTPSLLVRDPETDLRRHPDLPSLEDKGYTFVSKVPHQNVRTTWENLHLFSTYDSRFSFPISKCKTLYAREITRACVSLSEKRPRLQGRTSNRGFVPRT